MITVFDPLKIKIHTLLGEGTVSPLNQARLRYGTQLDVDTAVANVKRLSRGFEPYVMIDLTPFERFGRFSDLLDKLGSVRRPRPVLMLMGKSIIAQLMSQTKSLPIPIAVFKENGCFEELIGGAKQDQRIIESIQKKFRFGQTGDLSLANFRLTVANVTLTKLLHEYGCVEIPSKGSDDSVFLYGRYWRQMPNGMLITSFLNVKKFGKDCEVLTTLAYEVVLQLSQCFRRDLDTMAEFDLLVVPNNTALFLASTVQAIIGKPIVVIDRLGPIPAPNIPSYNLAEQLELKKVVLLEEVMATGSEVDRAVFFLGSLGAVITKIVAFFNLEVGMPLLANKKNITSLCRPKRELRYVYRSK